MNSEAKTKVVVLTANYRVTGTIDLLPGSRMTDFLLECREFMAITPIVNPNGVAYIEPGDGEHKFLSI